MLLTILSTVVLALSFFSPENIVSTIVGVVVTTGLTQIFKNATGAYGLGAFAIAVILSVVIGGVAVVASAFLTGSGVTWETVPQAGLQIFALATMAYKLLLADKE